MTGTKHEASMHLECHRLELVEQVFVQDSKCGPEA